MQRLHDQLSMRTLTTSPLDSRTFVDDVSLTTLGRFKHVTNTLVSAGCSFAASLRFLKLLISVKSLVLSSDKLLAPIVARQLKLKANVKISTAATGRDLGILHNTTAKRNTSLQANRISKATKRMKRISILAKSVRGARRLISTGALPQALWGQNSISLAPTVLSRLRSSTAAATGMTGAGRCATTAIAIGIGHNKDPAILHARNQVDHWISVWRSDSRLRALTYRH